MRMQITIEAERPDSPDASALIEELEDHLSGLYAPENRHGLSVARLINEGVDFFVLRVGGAPAGCGGIKLVPGEYGELKRMYVRPQFRGQRLGELLIARLAEHARAHGQRLLRLETGVHQHAAIALYERVGFRPIPPFGTYPDDDVSRCYELALA